MLCISISATLFVIIYSLWSVLNHCLTHQVAQASAAAVALSQQRFQAPRHRLVHLLLPETLVARGERLGVCLAVIPGNAALDLKALAKAMGDRKADTVPLKEVQPLTGYIRGGVTALAARKDYPVYLDEYAQLYDRISISAGQRGMQILLAPEDYRRAVNATYAPIAKDKE